MSLIKTNYNNLAIKLPLEIEPVIYCYWKEDNKLLFELNSFLEIEKYYNGFVLEVYVNGELKFYLDEHSEQDINTGLYIYELIDENLFNQDQLDVYIKGIYIDKYNGIRNVPYITKTVYRYPKISDDIVCSEHLLVNDEGGEQDGL